MSPATPMTFEETRAVMYLAAPDELRDRSMDKLGALGVAGNAEPFRATQVRGGY